MEMNKGRELKNLVLTDGPVDDFIVVDRFPEIDYVLIYRNAKYEPWVAAWNYNDERKSWGQGHYFKNLVGAMGCITALLREKEQENDLASKIEYDYGKNHLWEDMTYPLEDGWSVNIYQSTDVDGQVNIKLLDEKGDWVEWFTDRPECIEENVRYLIDLYID